MLVKEFTINEDEEARQAYDFEHNMKIKNGIYDSCPKSKDWDENMKKMVDTMHKISDFYEIPVPRYYFLKDMGKARGTATPAFGHRTSGIICLKITATVYTAIHEMAHIVCFHLEKKGAKQGHGHGSLFIGILTYLYQRLGYWDDEIRNIPLFACKIGENGEYLDMLEYDYDTLWDAGYLPKDEYTDEGIVKMFLQRGNYKEVLAKIDEHDLTDGLYYATLFGREEPYTEEQIPLVKRAIQDMVDSLEDTTIDGIAFVACCCYDFDTLLFKENGIQHIVDCYIDGMSQMVFDFISYNEMDLFEC